MEDDRADEVDPSRTSLFALKRRRDKFRKGLTELLGKSEATDFLQLIWSLNALQNGQFDLAKRFGPNFSRIEMEQARERFRFAPWWLETLVNEYLTTSFNPGRQVLDLKHPGSANGLVGALSALENAEDGVWLKTGNIFHLIGHLSQRQFPWQRGFAYFLQFYRPLFVFDFPEAEARFEGRVGISISQFALCGFALRAHLGTTPFAAMDIDLQEIGISPHERDVAIRKVSLPLLAARRQATNLRAEAGLTGYKKSVLRQSPCLILPDGRQLIAPLPDLIALRISSGIYYDIVGDGAINERMGKRFEDYVALLLDTFLPDIGVRRETEYSIRKGENYRSSDLVLTINGVAPFIVECKAKRASHSAKFAESPSEAEGLSDLAHGIFQIWRHVSHHRRRLVGKDMILSASPIGVLLTLDTWADMSRPTREEIFRLAREIRQSKAPDIAEEDMIRIGFLHIEDFEGILSTATPESLIAAAERWLGDSKYDGWSLRTVHAEAPGRKEVDHGPMFDRLPRPSGMSWWTPLARP
ncbi:hypothetical protein [Mesorhizobium delmotii]|uniref:Uncharacterized protein n=1 Tax=Mesorhizobium delmotii TaxID=1631247 RepID=A0A2P9AFR5_9HYPH|nr:hypothetical protein [Mesorhizobium delmotii]SJM29970.1 conserved hypothetical protein [Mesorhizobium delmotii]